MGVSRVSRSDMIRLSLGKFTSNVVQTVLEGVAHKTGKQNHLKLVLVESGKNLRKGRVPPGGETGEEAGLRQHWQV